MTRQVDIILKISLLTMILCGGWLLAAGSDHQHIQRVYAQDAVLRASALEGTLPNQSDKHYFGLAPTIRDSWIVVTLAYEPRAELSLSGLINFSILTEDGFRRYVAGATIEQASIASGGRVSYDRVGNKLQASFKDSGRGEYTVVVYNNSTQAVSYTLVVEGGSLIDDIGQTVDATIRRTGGSEAVNAGSVDPAVNPGVATPAQAIGTATSTEVVGTSTVDVSDTASSNATTSNVTSSDVASVVSPVSAAAIYPEIRALRVTSSLDPGLDRHYLALDPATSNSIVSLNMQYGPLNEPALDDNVTFYVLTEDGLRRVGHGDRPENANIAVGFPSPYPDKPNELLAGFQAGGQGPYTVVISNRAALEVQYQMAVSNAVLVDQYGQTNEARAALVEYAAVANVQANANADANADAAPQAEPAISEVSVVPEADSNLILTSSSANAGANQRTIELQNQFNLPYQHHYYGLEPTIANGRVQVTLAYALTKEELSINPPNFWVLDEDSLRRVISGARPMDVNIASGAIVPSGADEGKLRATFSASGKGPYTVVIDNNSNSTAEYYIRVSGGFLTQAPADSELLLVLP